MIVFGIAYVGTLTIEMPFINLEKMAFGSKREISFNQFIYHASDVVLPLSSL